jgi:hypothetical protein
MRGVRANFAGAVRALAVALVAAGCTEDPKLDRVGGNGSGGSDARPSCSESTPDARPRSFPCDVEAVLRARCQRCHNSSDELDRCSPAKTCLRGPFPLLTWSDTHANFDGTPVFELMQTVVETDFMPLQSPPVSPPAAPLDADQKATLLAWVRSCAPPGTAACAGTDASH